MPLVVLRAHPSLQSKRYMHNGVDVTDKWTTIDLSPDAAATLREFSSGRILAELSDANISALATVGLTVETGGAIVPLPEQPSTPTRAVRR